jgi:hypothetical protein
MSKPILIPTPTPTPTPPQGEFVVRQDHGDWWGSSVFGDLEFQGLYESLGPIKRYESAPEEVWAWEIDFYGFKAFEVKLLSVEQYWVKEVQQCRVSSDGYALHHYRYDSNGNRIHIRTEYVHQGEIYEGPVVLKMKKMTSWWMFRLHEAKPLEFHEVDE